MTTTPALARGDWTLVAAAAALMTAAYPPLAVPGAAFVCLLPAALLILRGTRDPSPSRRLAWQGFWYGALTHAILLYWLAGALWSYGRKSILLYPAVAVAFGVLTAGVFLLAGMAARRSPARLMVVLPAGVAGLEWVVAQLDPGLPWHQLALTLTPFPFLLQPADLVGAEGLGFLLAVVNVAIALAWCARHRPRVALRHLEVAGILVLGALLYGAHRWYSLAPPPGPRVAMVQPNIGPHDKWTPGWEHRIVERTMRLAERALRDAHPVLVTFPETALPATMALRPDWSAQFTQLAHQSGSTIVSGAVETEVLPGEAQRRYNAAISFEPRRVGPVVVHRKRRLVPFIERVPRRAPDLTRTGFGGFTAGGEPVVTETSVGRVGTLLCYEIMFPGEARRLRRRGADVLVTLSNDAWFGRSTAPYQHFAHVVLRAVENRVSVVRSANSGISGVVDPLGRVVASTEPFVETYLVAQVARPLPVPLAAHLGGLVGPAALLVLAVAAVRGRLAERLALPGDAAWPRPRGPDAVPAR